MPKDTLRTIHISVVHDEPMYQLLIRIKGEEKPVIHELGKLHRAVAHNCLRNVVDTHRQEGIECEIVLEEVKEVDTVKICETIPMG